MMLYSKNQDLDFSNCDVAKSKYLTPFHRKTLIKHLQTELRPEYRRRLEIMLLADMGKSQSQICQLFGCSQEMARYWITIAKTGMAHTWQEQPIGRPKTVNDDYLRRLRELVSHSPREYGYGFKTWTARWLSKHLASELGIEISDRHIGRLLRQMGLSTRQKPTCSDEELNEDSRIKISDLEGSSKPELHWSFDLTKSNP
jgi:transposase